jgi:phosphatidylinositol alpha-1,6-mannosyltransferase
MKVLTTHEFHYVRYKDSFYDPRNYTNSLYGDLLASFEKVVLVGRCKTVASKPTCQEIDKSKIDFVPISDFSGYINPFGMLLAFWQARKAVGLADRYWLSAPGFVAFMVAFWLKKAGIFYFIDMVGNPADVTRAKTIWMPKWLSMFIVRLVEESFKRFCKGSKGVLAVTEKTLQSIYPSSVSDNDFGISNVLLSNAAFNKPDRDFRRQVFKIIIVGALLKYKGHAYLFEALSRIKGLRQWLLFCVGEGPERKKLEEKARRLGIADHVIFFGRIDWGPKLFKKLDESHLFVLSSLTEGMPRVVIEAMARGLPVIATAVGGVPEIIKPELLVPPCDSRALAEKIAALWNKPERLEEISERNFRLAEDFRSERLGKLRRAWFQWMRDNGDEPEKITWSEFVKGKMLI